MQAIGDLLSQRGPTTEEYETQAHVFELCVAWERGDITTEGVCAVCTPKERFTALRFSEPGDDQDRLRRLVDILCRRIEGEVWTDHGYVTNEALGYYQYQRMTDHEGKKAWVSPLHTQFGIASYPDVSLPPSEQKRQRAHSQEQEYLAYRREQARGRARGKDKE